jgi:hypothetical protein
MESMQRIGMHSIELAACTCEQRPPTLDVGHRPTIVAMFATGVRGQDQSRMNDDGGDPRRVMSSRSR